MPPFHFGRGAVCFTEPTPEETIQALIKQKSVLESELQLKKSEVQLMKQFIEKDKKTSNAFIKYLQKHKPAEDRQELCIL